MTRKTEAKEILLLPDPIRVETALSRYPIHTLDKHKASAPPKKEGEGERRLVTPSEINIVLNEKDGDAESQLVWRVTYNASFGQPGPVAYKLDSLVVNRKIEEAKEEAQFSGKPFPEYIRLGSMRDIAETLRLGGDTSRVKLALRQNASAFIVAKIRYRRAGKTVKKLEADFNRYAVVFTGERLPDGTDADGVYIVLHPVYRKILSDVETRPIDYNYLKALPPTPQRFYELLSFTMHGTLKYDRHRAKLAYSEFCTYAPQTRYYEWEKVRKQMAKVHFLHKESGYILKYECEPIRDREGKADWLFFYTPGPKALEEFKAFNKRHESARLEDKRESPETAQAKDPIQLDFSLSSQPRPQRKAKRPAKAELPPLVQELVKRGVSEKSARELGRDCDAGLIERKIKEFDWKMTLPELPDRPAGLLVTSIREEWGDDPKFLQASDQKRLAEEKRSRQREAALKRQHEEEKDAAEKAIKLRIVAFRKGLSASQLAELETAAIAAADVSTRQSLESPGHPEFQRIMRDVIIDQHIRHLLETVSEPA